MGIKMETAADAEAVEMEPVRIGIDIQGEFPINISSHEVANLRDRIQEVLTDEFASVSITGWMADHGARPKDAD